MNFFEIFFYFQNGSIITKRYEHVRIIVLKAEFRMRVYDAMNILKKKKESELRNGGQVAVCFGRLIWRRWWWWWW